MSENSYVAKLAGSKRIEPVHSGHSEFVCANRGHHEWLTYEVGQRVPCCGIFSQHTARACKTCGRHEELHQ
jgi:hypothetical protein